MKLSLFALLLALVAPAFASNSTPDMPYPDDEAYPCETYEPGCIRDNDGDGYEDNEEYPDEFPG